MLRRIIMLAALLAGSAPAQTNHLEPNLLEIRFKDGQQIRLRDGEPKDVKVGGRALRGVRPQGVFTALRAGGAQWQRSHPGVSEAFIDKLRGPQDMNLYFRLRLPDGADLTNAIAQLESLAEVDKVFRVPKPAPPPVVLDYTSPTNSSGDWQRYLDAAPVGVDARFAWSNNFAGSGVRVCDIEYDWNTTHADLPALTRLDGTPLNAGFGHDHGTAVLGEMAGKNDGLGVRGIAYNSSYYINSPYTVENSGYNLGAAIIGSLTTLTNGDVILIEQQQYGPNGQFVPMEWYQPYYAAIRAAVSNGVIVVEAAGNGAQNLDDAIYSTGNGGHYPFLPANDSGAILVGAGAPPQYPSPRSRLSFSNYGTTVDLQGYGYLVLTTGYGDLLSSDGTNKLYTSAFSGTSSASPIVAGAAAVIQQAYRLAHGTSATPAQVRAILRDTGTPQQGTDSIGPLPDLRAAILGLSSTNDVDGDGVLDLLDNCPSISNAGQADDDGDSVGNACDNCAAVFNPGQEDLDSDLVGNACDPDRDGDGIANAADNCPDAANAGQADADGDGIGDACDACTLPQPVYKIGPAPGTPVITDDPGGQNNLGDNFDLGTNGGFAGTRFQCGFGDFGRVYINYDATNLYIGAYGCDISGINNAMVLFLGLNTLTDDKLNLWDEFGAPRGLDFLHNLQFTAPMDVAIVLGDEYGDGNYPNFNLLSGYDFGQGLFYLSATSFVPVAGIKLSQFDGTDFIPTSNPSGDDDANQRTDRWEASIPWTSLNAATGFQVVTQLFLCGVFASDGVNGVDRYLSGNYLGQAATCTPGQDGFNNFAFGFVTMTPLAVFLGDLDVDGLNDGWEIQHYGSTSGAATSDTDTDGFTSMQEFIAGTAPTNGASFFRASDISGGEVFFQSYTGRVYRLLYNDNLVTGAWQDVSGQTNIPGTGSTQSLIDSNQPPVRNYRLGVELH